MHLTKYRIAIVVVLASSLMLGCSISNGESAKSLVAPTNNGKAEDRREAAEAAKVFLSHVDSETTDQHWPHVSKTMQQSITSEKFKGQVRLMHQNLGRVEHREMSESGFTDNSQAPEGESYYVVVYVSTYKRMTKRTTATEQVTLLLDGGRWRVAGYFAEYSKQE